MKGIRGRLILHFGLILLLIILLLEGLFCLAVHTFYLGTAQEALVTRATTFTAFVNKYSANDQLKEKTRYILENISEDEYAKIDVLDLNGRIVLNSYGFQTGEIIMTPDVEEALQGKTGVHVGWTPESQERVIAVSSPLTYRNHTIGVLRYSISAEPLYQAVGQIALYGGGVGAAIVLLALLLCLVAANRIVDPIEELTRAVSQMAKGNFSIHAPKHYDDEVGALAEMFTHMAKELEKNEKLKNDFISSISHELRTPLTSIKGWTETMITGNLKDREETMMGLEVVAKETDRLIGLVEDLLDFSKFQSKEMKLNRETVDLRVILEDLRVQFAVRAQEKQVALHINIPPQPLVITGDPNRLKQVFVNLLDNAFKFTRKQDTVTLDAEVVGDQLILSVSDTGEGIAPEELNYLTQKFYKGSSKLSGSGLGLAICKEIIELHGGKMTIKSKKGEGTTVSIALPSSPSPA